MKRFILVFSLLVLLPTVTNAAMFDPSFNFSTVATAHFIIYYHQGIEKIAARAAFTAEEVHDKLTGLLQWEPEGKTHIVITDNSDFANGLTTVVPYNVIYLQTAPPSTASTIGEYDNWLRLLIVHEYAHVLTSDPVRGYSKTARDVFGKVVPVGDLLNLLTFVAVGPPNMMMPRWWHEGMSTWAETELTASGRGRSSYYQMLYRTAVAEKNLPGIDRINGDIPYWPEGNAPYIFGSKLIQHIAENYGKDRPGKLSILQSGQFPYFINKAPATLLSGRGYAAIYNEMLVQLRMEQSDRIKKLAVEPFTATRRLGKTAVAETNPRYSHDGKMLAFNRNDRHTHPVIVIKNSDNTVKAEFRRLPGNGSLAWSPDNEKLFFSQAKLSREGNYYNDLYQYDLKSEKIKRLTYDMRAAEPDLSPDGSKVIFVKSGRGSQNIGMLELNALIDENSTGTLKLLTDFEEARISSPRWSPDGHSIIFAQTDINGKSSLNLLPVKDLAIKELLKNSHSIDTPAWMPDGRSILFSSDQTGVYNIFNYRLETGEISQATHLLSGAFAPDVSPADQTLAISEYTSFAPAVALVAKESQRRKTSLSPSIKSGLYPVNSLMTEYDTKISAASPQNPAPYSPLPTLLPKFWMPTLTPETVSDSAFGVMTAGQDVLGYHTYLAKVMYGPGFDKGYYDALYQYRRYVPTYTLRGYALPTTYTDLVFSGDFTEIERGLLVSVSVPIGSLESGLSVNTGYHLRELNHLTPGTSTAFNGKPPFAGRRDSFFTGLDYSATLKYPWSITAEEGRNISARFEYYGKASGSELETREYTASWAEHFPIHKHHNIMTRLNGGLADGEQSAQQSFQLGGISSFMNPFALRGYESHFTTGSRVATATIEYRFPLNYFFSGQGTAPLFYDRLHGALFIDAGEAWDTGRSFKVDNVMTGTGLELRLDLTLGYWLKITPAIGYAHGFDKPFGTDQIYFNVYANL